MRQDHRRTVHIPVVPPERFLGAGAATGINGEGRLLEVYAQPYTFGDDASDSSQRHAARTGPANGRGAMDAAAKGDERADSKRWNRVAAPLRAVGQLYEAGLVAVGKVHKLGIELPRLALYQHVRRESWLQGQRLHSPSGKGPTEGESVQLGLAVALLMGASGSRYSHALATGALERPLDYEGPSVGAKDRDSEVLTVGGLAEKLRLVLHKAASGTFSKLPSDHRGAPHLLMFTPMQYQRGGGYVNVEELPEVSALSEHGIRVVPVRWLSEVAQHLGANRTRYVLGDRICQAATVLFAALATGLGSQLAWEDQRIPMTFLPGGSEADDPEPFRVCELGGKTRYPVPLPYRGSRRVMAPGETLGWHLQVGRPDSLDSWLSRHAGFGGYYVAHVLVAESSLPRAFIHVPATDSGAPLRVPPGEVHKWQWELDTKPEAHALVILSQRQQPPDVEKINQELSSRVRTTGHAGILDAVNILTRLAPGSVTFFVETNPKERACVLQRAS